MVYQQRALPHSSCVLRQPGPHSPACSPGVVPPRCRGEGCEVCAASFMLVGQGTEPTYLSIYIYHISLFIVLVISGVKSTEMMPGKACASQSFPCCRVPEPDADVWGPVSFYIDQGTFLLF